MVCKFLIIVLLFGFASGSSPCQSRRYEYDSIVCVCDANGCDNFDANITSSLPVGTLLTVESSKAGARFQVSRHQFDGIVCDDDRTYYSSVDSDTIELSVDRSKRYQSIIGFGGAITDAATMVIKSLGDTLGKRLVDDYYGPDGIGYTLGRVPIGGSDFSTHPYSYNDITVEGVEDLSLSNFTLQPEDREYKIPVIKMAMSSAKQANRKFKLFAAPWSAPAWMKTNNKLTGRGFIKGGPGSVYYDSWAHYFVRY